MLVAALFGAAAFFGSAASAAATTAAFLAFLPFIDPEERLRCLADGTRDLLHLSGLSALLVGLLEPLESLLSSVLIAGRLSLHHLSDALSESLRQALSSAALAGPSRLLGFTAESHLVAARAAALLGSSL